MARAPSPTAAARGPAPRTSSNGARTFSNGAETTGDAFQRRARQMYAAGKKKSFEYASDRQCQVAALTGAGGAVCIGAPAAGLGLLAGGVTGGAVGILPAIFTFGLSIPFGAVIGAGCGMVFTGATGATVGFAGGSAIGYTGYSRRDQIAAFLKRLGTKAQDGLRKVTTKVMTTARAAKSKVAHIFGAGMSAARDKSGRLIRSTSSKTKEYASNKEVQAAAASVVGGAVVLGTGGAVTGGAIGAAFGVVPAIFTFGLSIPFCAVVGGACGTAVGGTAGAVTGGGAYATYKRRAQIHSFLGTAAKKACHTEKSVHAKMTSAK